MLNRGGLSPYISDHGDFRYIVIVVISVNIFNGWRQHWGGWQKKHIVTSEKDDSDSDDLTRW